MDDSNKGATPKTFFYNGLASAVSSLALRFAGMLFNVYLSNAAGAQAMGLLSLIYSVWGFALTAGCAGGGLAAARTCAESFSLGQDVYGGARKCLRYSLLCGCAVGSVLILAASPIGAMLSDSRTVTPLRLLAISLPFISMSGSLSGYFDSGKKAYRNALSRITEQIIRIGATVLIVSGLETNDAQSTCIAIILGGVIAEISSFVMLYTAFRFDEAKNGKKGSKSNCSFGKIAAITLPVTVSAGIRSGLVSIEHILIPKGLREFGCTSSEALELFGTVHGMAIPVILFCIAIPSAFASLLIPRFAEFRAVSNIKEIRYVAARAYRPAICFSVGVAAYLVLSAFLLGEILYPGTDTARYIYAFAPLIPIMYVDSVSDSVLKGMGEQLYSMKINIADALISVAAVFFLVPQSGITGYIIAIYLSETFNTCTSITKVIKLTGYKIPVFRFVLSPLIAATISAKLTGVFYNICGFINQTILAICGGTLFTVIYILILTLAGNISREERSYMRKIMGIKKESAPIAPTEN